MTEILGLLRDSSPILVALAVLAYLTKVYVEKWLGGIAGRVEAIARTSLDVKKELRHEERGELVALRVAIEKWEYFLQTAMFDVSMTPPATADVATLYTRDTTLFLDVRIAAVKAGIYLRDADLERQWIDAILRIRNAYYPILNEGILRVLGAQLQLRPIESKLAAFARGGVQAMACAPTAADQEESRRLQMLITDELQRFAQSLLERYPAIASQMADLKSGINTYIYRPMKRTGIDQE